MSDEQINLPPLPERFDAMALVAGDDIIEVDGYTREQMKDYASAAVFADRVARAAAPDDAREPFWFAIDKNLRLVEVPKGTPGAFAFDLRHPDAPIIRQPKDQP